MNSTTEEAPAADRVPARAEGKGASKRSAKRRKPPVPTAKIQAPFRDKVVDIITGRAKMDELKDALKRWKSEGGDKIRDEYQAALPSDFPVFGA